MSLARISHLKQKVASVFAQEGVGGVLRRVRTKVLAKARGGVAASQTPPKWLEKYTPTAEQLESMKAQSPQFRIRPLISVLLPVYNTDSYVLTEAIESVRAQAYPFWELCIADDASPNQNVRELLEKYRNSDPRIKICFREKNGHIAHATNSALELASGDFVALLDHDDTLSPHAFFRIAEALNAAPTTDIFYSNEDKIEGAGPGEYRTEPAFKGAWSPINFLSFMYIGHLGAYRTSLVREAGGFRPGYEGSQDYDLALRVSEKARLVTHIPDILYHWRKIPGSVAGDLHAKPYAFEAGKKGIRDALLRRGLEGTVEDTARLGIYRVRITPPTGTKVSVFVLGGSGPDTSIRSVTEDPKGCVLDIVQGAIAEYPSVASGDNAVKLFGPETDQPISFWTRALEYGSGEWVALCDHCVWPLTDEWLSALLDAAYAGDGGVITGKILSREGTVLHAGYSLQNGALHSHFFGASVSDGGYCARLVVPHDVGVASTGFTLVRRAILEAVFAQLAGQQVSREDIEVVLAKTCRDQGFRVLYTPYATCVYNGARLATRIVLTVSKVESGGDIYYPRGLRTDPPDFQIAD